MTCLSGVADAVLAYDRDGTECVAANCVRGVIPVVRTGLRPRRRNCQPRPKLQDRGHPRCPPRRLLPPIHPMRPCRPRRSFRRRSCPVFSRHLRQARASNRRKPCHVPRRNRPRRQPQCRAPMRSSGCCAPRSRPSITPPDRQLRRLPRAGRARLSAGQRRCETSRQQARSAFNGAESGVLSGGRKLA